jgi:hypothetical protein
MLIYHLGSIGGPVVAAVQRQSYPIYMNKNNNNRVHILCYTVIETALDLPAHTAENCVLSNHIM